MEKKEEKPKPSLTLRIYLGTYEGRLYSLSFVPTEKKLVSKFSFSASQNALRVICHSPPFLFVSGTDEIIHMYNINTKTSNGDLVTYSGSINDIKIHKNWLIACGDEPTIPLWKMDDFTNIVNIKGHKGAVLSLALHQQGAFCVSCGRDKRIIIFDMTTGRKIEKYEMEFICNKVSLFNKSKLLLAVFDFHLYIFDLMKSTTNKEEAIVKKIDYKDRILDAFVIKKKLVVFFSDGSVQVNDIIFEEKKFKDIVECGRLRLETPEKVEENDLDVRPRYVSASESEKIKLLTVGYSNNDVYIFDLNKILKWSKKDNEVLKKYYKVNVVISGKITCIDSEIIEGKEKEEED